MQYVASIVAHESSMALWKDRDFLLTQKFEKMGGLGLFIAIMWIAVMATGDN